MACYFRGVPDKTGREQGSRVQGGRFAPGRSGNPSGRPKGSRDKRTVLLQELVDGGGETIVKKLVALAKSGKPWAVRLAVERLLPRLERRVDVELSRIETAADVGAAVADVIDLAAGGSLTIEEARAFLQLIEQQRKAIETADLAVRLELLEQREKEY
jgi:hypothetical protein